MSTESRVDSWAPQSVFAGVFLVLSLLLWKILLCDADVGWHVRAGEWILSHGSMPGISMSAYIPAAHEWTAHEWLAEILMGMAHKAFGIPGVVFLFSGLYAAFALLLYVRLRDRNLGVPASAALVVLCMSASVYNIVARPHVFSWLFILLWCWILDRHREGVSWKRGLWVLPASMLLWVNMHGGWFSGFMILGIYGLVPFLLSGKKNEEGRLAGRRFRELFTAGVFCLFAAMVNPYGPKIFVFVYKVLTASYWVNNIMEYFSPNFHDPYQNLALIYLVVFASSLLVSGKRVAWETAGVLAMHLYMGLYALRAFPLFVVVSAPVLAECLADTPLGDDRPPCRSGVWPWGIPWAALLVSAVVFSTSVVSPVFGKDPLCADAAEFLSKSGQRGNLFANIQYGGYLVYRGWPDTKVFIDGRVDAYGKKRFEDLIKIERMRPGWREALKEYGVGTIVYQTNSVFSWRIENEFSNEWVKAYSDNTATVFFRKGDV